MSSTFNFDLLGNARANKKDSGMSSSGFNFGASSSNQNDSTSKFSFGSQAETDSNVPASILNVDNNFQTENKPIFAFETTKKNDDQTANSFNTRNNKQDKPGFSFGNQDKTVVEPTLTFSNTVKNIMIDSSMSNHSESSMKALDSEKPRFHEGDKDLLKSYQVPSFNHLLDANDMDVDTNIDNNNEFFDVELDQKTNLPIRKLEFNDTQKSLLNEKTHLNFAIANKTETGVLFATPKDQVDKTDKNGEVKLFPFDLIPKNDESGEYVKFLNDVYKEMEPLLTDKNYESYLNMDDDNDIGVVSVIKQRVSERSFELSKTMSALLSHLQILINKKLQKDIKFEDQWVVNYENIISVLYLMNALYFGEDGETIVLFQQWVERIDIQPDTKVLQKLLEDPEIPCLNPTFWSVYLKKLVLKGSFAVIAEDFKVSQYEELKETDYNLYSIMDDFYHLVSSYDPISFSKDITDFLQWKKRAVALRETTRNTETSNFAVLSEILELLNIISGSLNAIEENSTKWFEYFMGRFLYQMPSKKLVQGYISETLALDSFEKPLEGIESWDSICVDLFNYKFLTVISSLESLDKTIGTYVGVLLEAAGLLKKYYNDSVALDVIEKVETENNIKSNINRMVEDLALTYLNNQELFPTGVGILIKSGSGKARGILAELLPTYDIKDSDDFEWVLEICSELKLKNTMSTIQQIQGEKMYEKHLIGNALVCFAESQSMDKVVSITWRIFEETLINRGLDEKLAVQLFDSTEVNSNVILRQSLSPVYILDQILKNNNGYDNLWFERLISLFTFKYLHGYYKPGLLMIILDTLNTSVYNYEKLLKLIEAINNYEDDLAKNTDVSDKSEKMYALLVNESNHYPATVSELLVAVRRGIALDITFGFLE